MLLLQEIREFGSCERRTGKKFNGGLGLCFGYLYRKHGIGYAMTAHGAAHLISDLLMIMFL